MAWNVGMIEKEWLGAPISVLALPPEEVLAAFARVEALLGHAWIDHAHQDGALKGAWPLLQVVSMGQRLAALDDVPNAHTLITKILGRDVSADAELTAIYLVRRSPEVQVELEPAVGERKADFRARHPGGEWVFVEVTFPDWSEATERARTVLERVTELVSQVKKSFALEVFLRREPTDAELANLLAAILDFCNREGRWQVELRGGLGLLLLNNSPPGQVVTDEHGDEPRPRIGMARVIVGPQEPYRHLAVRMAFSDQRAEAFLTSEARQLPKHAPGLIMIGTSRAPGASNVWKPLLQRRFQPNMHTRVSGVCLFAGGIVLTNRGQAWLASTKVLLNRHAARPLPDWIEQNLKDAGAEFDRFTRPTEPRNT